MSQIPFSDRNYSSYTMRGINVIPEKRVVRNKCDIYVFIMSYHSAVRPMK